MSTEKKKEPSKKLQIALYWAASCGGCEIGMLDIDEKILDLTAAADIVFWPVAIDTKYKDVEALEDRKYRRVFFQRWNPQLGARASCETVTEEIKGTHLIWRLCSERRSPWSCEHGESRGDL